MKYRFIVLLLFAALIMRAQVIDENLDMFPGEVKRIILEADRTKSICIDVAWFDKNTDRIKMMDERIRYHFLNDSIIEQKFKERKSPEDIYYGLIRGKEILDYDLENNKVLNYYPDIASYDSAGFTVYRYKTFVQGDTMYSYSLHKKDSAGRTLSMISDVRYQKKRTVVKKLTRYEYIGDSIRSIFSYKMQGAIWKLTGQSFSKHFVREGGKLIVDTTVTLDIDSDAMVFIHNTWVMRTALTFDTAGRILLKESLYFRDIKSEPDTSADTLFRESVLSSDTTQLRTAFAYDRYGRISFVEKKELRYKGHNGPVYHSTLHVSYPDNNRRRDVIGYKKKKKTHY